MKSGGGPWSGSAFPPILPWERDWNGRSVYGGASNGHRCACTKARIPSSAATALPSGSNHESNNKHAIKSIAIPNTHSSGSGPRFGGSGVPGSSNVRWNGMHTSYTPLPPSRFHPAQKKPQLLLGPSVERSLTDPSDHGLRIDGGQSSNSNHPLLRKQPETERYNSRRPPS